MFEESLNALLPDCSFLAFDFETTGLSAFRDRVVELGVCTFRLDRPERSTYSQLFNPGQEIPAAVIAIHSIDNATVQSAPTLAEKADEILALMQGRILVAHHASFDIAFLTCELQRLGKNPPEVIVLDSFQLARRLLPGAPSYKLSELLRYLELEMDGQAHRALPDALACADLFQACLQRLPQWESLSLQALLQQHPQIRVDAQAHPEQQTATQRLLNQAIAAQSDLLIAYTNARNETLKRRVSPLLLGGYGRYSYLEAFCHLRGENRQFLLHRIEELQPWADSDSESA